MSGGKQQETRLFTTFYFLFFLQKTICNVFLFFFLSFLHVCLHVCYKQKSTPPQDKPQAIERTTKCCSFLNREKCERPHGKEKEKNRHAKKKKPIGEKKKLFFFHLSLTLQLPIIPVSGISPQPPMSHKMQCSPTTSIAREKKKKRNYIYMCVFTYTHIYNRSFFFVHFEVLFVLFLYWPHSS